jgi:hypothetical protein
VLCFPGSGTPVHLPAPKVTVEAYDRVPPSDEDALMEYVSLSPVSVNINADRAS